MFHAVHFDSNPLRPSRRYEQRKPTPKCLGMVGLGVEDLELTM